MFDCFAGDSSAFEVFVVVERGAREEGTMEGAEPRASDALDADLFLRGASDARP
eukprot:SAG11_NODE_4240_length_1992_cov_1.222927_2_plen_54_part_00